MLKMLRTYCRSHLPCPLLLHPLNPPPPPSFPLSLTPSSPLPIPPFSTLAPPPPTPPPPTTTTTTTTPGCDFVVQGWASHPQNTTYGTFLNPTSSPPLALPLAHAPSAATTTTTTADPSISVASFRTSVRELKRKGVSVESHIYAHPLQNAMKSDVMTVPSWSQQSTLTGTIDD